MNISKRFSKRFSGRLGVVVCLPMVVAFGCASVPTTTHDTQTVSQKHASAPKVALVLGGGGAKGLAHVGVIAELEKAGIYPDVVIGTSAGAIVGSIYAGGKSGTELVALAQDFDVTELLDISPSHQGLIEGKKLRQYVNTHAGADVSKFPKPFGAVATDETGQAVLFRSGETGLIVQASSSVQKLFIAPRIPEPYGKKYYDGGASALVPSRFAESLGADVVIAVDVLGEPKTAPQSQPKAQTAPTVTLRTSRTGLSADIGGQVFHVPLDISKLPFDIGGLLDTEQNISVPPELWSVVQNPESVWQKLEQSYARMATVDIHASDVILRPKLDAQSVFDTTNPELMIQAGRDAVRENLPAIRQVVLAP